MLQNSQCLLRVFRVRTQLQSQCFSSATRVAAKERKNNLFDIELKRQRTSVGRIEKVKVKYVSPSSEAILAMNKYLSTPYDCARHISEGVCQTSAIAVVNGVPWDMHRPLDSDCELELISMMVPKFIQVNYAFWRTCSLILGAVVETAFKDSYEIHMHSFPPANIKSGSFVCDVFFDYENWRPTDAELKALSAEFVKITNKNLPVERLVVSKDIALEIFEENPFKSKQIPNIAENGKGFVTLYRIGDHIDISKGPMIGNTGLVGRCTVSAVHKLESEESDRIYRFQGLALPRGLILNHFIYNILEERAKKFNDTMWLPMEMLNQNKTIAAASN